MIRYNLLLCQAAFLQYFLGNGAGISNRKDNGKVAAIIDQHRVVLSVKLLEFYQQHISMQGALYELLFEQAFSSEFYALETSSQYQVIEDEKSEYHSIDDALHQLSKSNSLDNPLIICDQCERCSEFIKELKPRKPFFSSDILSNSVYNQLKRNSVPFVLQVMGNEQSGIFTHWFGELFRGERQITVFDPYLISEHGLQSLFTYYIPQIESKTVLRIYTNADYCKDLSEAKEKLSQVCMDRKIKIEVNCSLSKKDQMHGRHIFLSGVHMCLDHGLDFLDGTNKTVRDCSITLTERENGDLDKLLHVHRYSPLFTV